MADHAGERLRYYLQILIMVEIKDEQMEAPVLEAVRRTEAVSRAPVIFFFLCPDADEHRRYTRVVSLVTSVTACLSQ